MMERTIIEKGGRVIDDPSLAKYLLQEDGFDKTQANDNQENTNQGNGNES